MSFAFRPLRAAFAALRRRRPAWPRFLLALVLIALAPATAGAQIPDLSGPGTPDHIGHAVHDFEGVRSQLASATGTQFGPTRTTTSLVLLEGQALPRLVTLTSSWSRRGEPFVEIVKATPAIGPWEASETASTTFMSYVVDDAMFVGARLALAGFRLVAVGDGFTFWRSDGGVLVRLIASSAAPSAGTHEPQAAIDFGAPKALAFFPCAGDVRKRLTDGLGIEFHPSVTVPSEREYSDGTERTDVVTHVGISTRGTPFVTVDDNGDSHEAPLEPQCTPTRTPTYQVFSTPDQVAAEAQLRAAGMQFVQRQPGIETEFKGKGGIILLAVHPMLVPTE